MTSGAGSLRIRVTRDGGDVRAEIERPAGLDLNAWLGGESVEAAATKIPLVFNLCAAAQEASARSAFGLAWDPSLDRRVAAETIREHALKLCVFWPAALGHQPDSATLALVSAPRALATALVAPLERGPRDWAEFETWMTNCPLAAASPFRSVVAHWEPVWASADLERFDVRRSIGWASATQGGRAVENSPAARMADAPLMREIEGRLGRGLVWRMAARLAELLSLCEAEPDSATVAPGMARAARGVMAMTGEVENGRVRRAARLSPTDFALARGGLIEQMLARLPAECDAPLEEIARLALAVADPCMPHQIEVADA